MKKRINARQYFEHLAASQQRQQRLKKAAAEFAREQQSPSGSPAPNPAPRRSPQPRSTEPRSATPFPQGAEPVEGAPRTRPSPSGHSDSDPAPSSADETSPEPPPSAFGGIHCAPTHPRRQRPRGRHSAFSEDLADAIFDAIAEFGHTDTGAAAKFGVAASTLSRWKRENEWFATDLEAARAEYKERILAEIRNAKKRDGSPDWRAYAWILERTFPDEFGRRTRKPPEPERKPTVDEYLDITPEEVLSPEKIERIRQAHEELVNDPESWEHKDIVTRAQERFEEMKAAYRGGGGE